MNLHSLPLSCRPQKLRVGSVLAFRQSLCVISAICLLAVLGCGGGPKSQPSPQVVEEHNNGVALMGKFDYTAAHEVFSKLASAHPDWLDVQVDLAIASLNRQQPGDDKAAAQILDTVIEKRPEDLRALYCRGILDLYSSEPEAAWERFRTVAEADPDDGYAQYFTGQCLFQLSRYDEALEHFSQAQQIDPYLRSAYYGAFQAAQQLGRADLARENFEKFQRLDDNPQARLAEIKYTRMGPKAEVSTVQPEESDLAVTPPAGNLFAEPETISMRPAAAVTWASFDSSAVAETAASTPNVTVCDINQDGKLDILISGAFAQADVFNAVMLQENGVFSLDLKHPLAMVSNVNAAVWGDMDNDGLTDVYLCRRGPNQLWRQTAAGQWADITTAAGTAAGDLDSVDGACFDADHDGDLDLFVVNADGPNELLNNNLDGTYRSLAGEQGIAGGSESRGIVVADLDNDRDVDIVVINAQPPHEVYRNDRLWNYEPAAGFAEFTAADIWSAVAADTDADGKTELFTSGPAGVTRWTRSDDGSSWSSSPLADANTGVTRGPLAVQDINGDGAAELVITTRKGWRTLSLGGTTLQSAPESTGVAADWALAAFDPRGYSLVAPQSGKPPVAYPPGRGRFPVVLLEFTGKESQADQMRSNASGIGVQAAVRVSKHWTTAATFRPQSGPGQSLQPAVVGLRGASQMDFVSIQWPDGVFQSESGLAAGGRHRIEETQRQVSSCPVVFAWNGERFEFVTDILGVGGIGFNVGRGEYSTPRPWENLLLPANLLVPRGNEYVIKIGEPMEEVMYLDAARLVAYDLPPGWNMTLDERLAVHGPAATGNAIFYQDQDVVQPIKAIDQAGADVLDMILSVDGKAAEPAARDRRFLGRTEPSELVVKFARPLDSLEGEPVLVFHGWIEYPYSQTMFAAWQAGAEYHAPTLEALDANGQWQILAAQFGYPAGMPREASLPLSNMSLPKGVRTLRLRTNMEIYFDAVYVVSNKKCPGAIRTELPLRGAIVSEAGFPRRTNHAQRRPFYEYDHRASLWDTQHQTGFYTDFGPAAELVRDTDDALAIVGPGEEIEVQFDHRPLAALSAGWTRRFVFEANGWCKDRDLLTKDGEKVAPLPARTDAQEEKIFFLHKKINRRFRSGS